MKKQKEEQDKEIKQAKDEKIAATEGEGGQSNRPPSASVEDPDVEEVLRI